MAHSINMVGKAGRGGRGRERDIDTRNELFWKALCAVLYVW